LFDFLSATPSTGIRVTTVINEPFEIKKLKLLVNRGRQ